MPYIPLSERLWFYVQPNDATGCWEWTGSFNGTGYGRLSYQKSIVLAHRVAYEVCRGDIGDAFVMHKCDNRKCVNPWHLEIGDQTANMRDMIQKGRARHPSPRPVGTRCKSGRHSWVPENIIEVVTEPHGTIKRSCKVCHGERRAKRLNHTKSKYYTPDL